MVQFLGQWRWIVIGAVAIVAFTLGMIGLGSRPGWGAWDDRVYGSLLLFRFATPGAPPYDATLEIARFLALASIAYATFRGVSAIFRDQWERFRIKTYFHDHVVVCGLGYSGMRLAKSFRNAPGHTRVVAIDVAPSIGDVDECRELGIYCLVGDATDGGLLKRAAVNRARSVVVTCGTDDVNAQVALLTQNAQIEEHHSVTCYVNIDEDELCRLLEQSAMSSHGRVDFEFFNVYRSGPRALLDAHGRTEEPPTGEAPPPVFMIGDGGMITHLVSEEGRRWALDRGDKAERIRIVLVAPHADLQDAKLRRRHPDLPEVCDLVPYNVDLSDPDTDAPQIDTVPSRVFVCFDDDAGGLRATIRIRKWVSQDVPIVLCTTGRSHAAHLLQLASSKVLPNVKEVGLLDEVCTAERLQNSKFETIAQAIHAQFVRDQTGIKSKDDPAMRDWKDLSEELKESNRGQAHDYADKLKSIDCTIAESTRWGSSRFTFTQQEVEELSKKEHTRWGEGKRRDGWTYGDPKDDALKHHPDLVEWKALPEGEREKDRSAVRLMPIFLARVGYEIVRTTANDKAAVATPAH